MAMKLLQDCKNNRPKNTRLMGLDLGTKMIGVAVSDSVQSLSTPIFTIHRTKFSKDISILGEIIDEFDVRGFILGLPLNEDGTEGPRCDATRNFADEMRNHPEIFGVNSFIALWDEGLSTSTVDDFMDNRVDMHKLSKINAKKSGLIDRLAAHVILQSALDSF